MAEIPARIAVTGASGFFGRHLVDHLAGIDQVESVLAMDIRAPLRLTCARCLEEFDKLEQSD